MLSNFKMPTNTILKFIFLYFNIVLFSAVVFYTESNILIVLLFYAMLLICLILVGFDITHPYTWFLPFFVLYSTSFSILHHIDQVEDINVFKMNDTLKLSWLAFITFIMVVTPKRHKVKDNIINQINRFNNSSLIIRTIFLFSIIGIILMCLYILSSGAVSKKEIKLEDSIFITLGQYSIHFFVFSFVLILINKIKSNKKFNKWFILSSIFISLLVIFIAGERDFLLRIILILIIVYNVYIKKLSMPKLLGLGIVGLFLISILQNLKGLFIREEFQANQTDNILVSLLSGEFISAGRNFQKLIQSNMEGMFASNNTLLTDLKFTLMNLPFMRVDINTITPTSWFNNTFYGEYVQRGGGKGFTLIGEGYINFGAMGIILWFLILGLIVRVIYKKSVRNINWFLGYIILIPHTIYCMRADLGIYFSSILKYIILPFLILFVYNYIVNQRNFRLEKKKKFELKELYKTM